MTDENNSRTGCATAILLLVLVSLWILVALFRVQNSPEETSKRLRRQYAVSCQSLLRDTGLESKGRLVTSTRSRCVVEFRTTDEIPAALNVVVTCKTPTTVRLSLLANQRALSVDPIQSAESLDLACQIFDRSTSSTAPK